MSLVGIMALLVSLGGITFSSVKFTRGRILIAILLLAIHVSTTLLYYSYVQTHVSDTAFYYFDRLGINDYKFGIGTTFVINFTQFLKRFAGATYLDSFFVFQGFGFFGLMLLMRLFQEIEIAVNARQSLLSVSLLFLPSLHFWTSAIGKDAPLFFAICLCAWAVMRIRRRWIVFCAGIFLMVLFRAHIALITVMSVALAAATHGRFTAGRRLALLTIAAVGAVILTGAVSSTLKLDITSSGSLSSFFAERDQIAAASSGSTTIGDAGYLMRLISLLFRPFFVDVSGFLGFVPSVENIGSVLLFGYLLIKWQQLRWLTRRVFFMRFALSFSIILLLLLASVNYNLGLGIRQRVMALPTLLSMLVAIWATRQYRFGMPLDEQGAKLLSQISANKPATENPQ